MRAHRPRPVPWGRSRGLPGLVPCALALAWLSLISQPAFAHGGEDHGDAPQPTTAVAGSPRVIAQSEAYELVGTLKGQRLTLYLDRFSDNAPADDATVTVTIDGTAMPAIRADDGTLSVTSARFAGAGNIDLVFNVSAKSGDDLLIGTLSLPKPVAQAAATVAPPPSLLAKLREAASAGRGPLLLALGALILGLLLRSPRKLLPLAATVGLLTLLITGVSIAHEGHDDGPAPAAPSDAPQRLADGSVFVPKPTQRILDVRTLVAKPESAEKTISLMGRVIADPNRSGLVQSINGGRVTPPAGGLPQLGKGVNKGDVLAMIERPIISADQATLAEKVGDIDQQVALAKAKFARAKWLADNGAGPRVAATDAELELAGLARRRSAVRQIGSTPEILKAPVDGVIASSKVVAGQVVQAQDVLFQVIDPHSLWIEALVYSDASAPVMASATALATDGTPLKLTFQGTGRTLQQQATVVQFSVLDPPAALSVGQAVTVVAPTGSSVAGILLPREAVVRGGNGETVVWRHDAPERFGALTVRAEPFDAARMVVRAGVKEGERIVVRGAELINQIR